MSRRRPNKQRRRRSPEPLADLGRGAAARCLPQEPRCWRRGEARSSGEPPQEGRYRDADTTNGQHEGSRPICSVGLLNSNAVAFMIRTAAGLLDHKGGFSAIPLQKPGPVTEREVLQFRWCDGARIHETYCLACCAVPLSEHGSTERFVNGGATAGNAGSLLAEYNEACPSTKPFTSSGALPNPGAS